MDWDKLRIFHAVAEAGSFTHAGESLNLSQSAVSRQIGALEESLKVSLFHRHARGLILTEQGELLYRTAHEVFAKLAMTEAQLAESKERPKGRLKITATVALGSTWLTPRMGEFQCRSPPTAVTFFEVRPRTTNASAKGMTTVGIQRPAAPRLQSGTLGAAR